MQDRAKVTIEHWSEANMAYRTATLPMTLLWWRFIPVIGSYLRSHFTYYNVLWLQQRNFGSRPSDHYFRSVCWFVCLSVCLFVQSFSQPFLIRFRSN